MRKELSVAAIAASVVGLSVTPRVLGALGVLPHGLDLFGWSDILATWNDSRLPGHQLPYRDVPFAYPPVVGYLAGAISLLVSGPVGYAVLWGLVIAGAAAAGGYVFARHAGPRRTLLYWSCAPQLLLLGGINFDVLAAVLLGMAAISARAGRGQRTGMLLAVATATKLFPAVSVPPYLWRRISAKDPRQAIGVAGVYAVSLVALYLPASVAAFPATRFVGAYAVDIGANPDSPWALLERGIGAIGVDGHLAVLALTYAGFALTYVGLVLPRARLARDPVVGFGLATVTLLLWSRLYSPQYSLWLLPFFVLLPLRARSFVLLALADIGVFCTIYPLTLSVSPADPLQAVFFTVLFASVALRVVALAVIWRDIARLVTA